MVIFHHVAVYKHHKRLFKIIQKQRKKQRSTQSTHSTSTQPVHFPQTHLRHPQQNFAVLFCSQFTLTLLCFRFLLPSTIEF